MWQRLDNRRKFRALVAVLALSPLVMWLLAVSDTVEAAQECARLRDQYASAGELDGRIADLRLKAANISESLGMVEGDATAFQTALLSAVSGFCAKERLELVDFPASETHIDAGLHMETIALVVEGGFIPTVRLVSHLENEARVGKLISTAYTRMLTRRDRRTVLRTTIHVQNVRKQP